MPHVSGIRYRIAPYHAVADSSSGQENDSLRVELHERTEQLRNAQLMAPAGIPAKETTQVTRPLPSPSRSY